MAEKTSKAEAIRDYIQSHRRAKDSTVSSELAKQGVEVDSRYVARIRKGSKTSKGTRPEGQANPKSTPRKPSGPRPYPQRSLEDALVIPQAIRDKNNGHAWAAEEVAKAALGISKNNNKFFYAAAASRDYGLTIGSRDTEKIELSELGRDIVFAGDEKERRQKTIDAFFGIDLFKRVYEHYGSAKLPEGEFLANMLQAEFGLASDFHSEFTRIFKANCKYLNIEKGLGPGVIVRKDEREEHSGDIKVVGEPKGKFDRTAFVIMPFSEKGSDERPKGFFGEALKNLITPAGNDAGFSVETAESDGSDIIQSTIIGQLLSADLVIADLTDHNPNVLFELGIRIAKELPVALIKAEGTGRIFDVDNMMRVFTYSPTLWKSRIAEDLPKLTAHIKAAFANAATDPSFMQILTGHRD